jgi:hypothetical protein
MKKLKIISAVFIFVVNTITFVFAINPISIETYLPKDSIQLSSYTWNGRGVSLESSETILQALSKHIKSFKQIEQDVRIPIEGPKIMMQLAPSAVFSYFRNRKNK